MGMPVAAAYVLTAMLAVPALIQMGVSLMAAHLFVVYFSIISAITPPVAVAAYAAAGIADANPNTVGWYATKIGLAAFLVPFLFVTNPLLLMEGPIPLIILSCISAVFGVTALAAGVQGFITKPLKGWQRILIIAAGLGLIDPNILTTAIGIVIIVIIFIMDRNNKIEYVAPVAHVDSWGINE